MSRISPRPASISLTAVSILLLMMSVAAVARAQSCKTGSEMDANTRSAIVSAGQRYFDMAAKGDMSGLHNGLAGAASDFAGIEAAVKDHQAQIASSHGAARPPFLLEADGAAPLPHAEFLCGVFNRRGQTADSAVFRLDGLAPGKYATLIFDAPSANPPTTLSFFLQLQGSEWKLRGLYFTAAEAAGHDADWYVTQARQYKTNREVHNAWLYYLQARILISPLPFMSTAATDKLYDESQPLQPNDFPTGASPADLEVGANTYKLIALFPQAVGNDLDLIVKYQSSDVSDSAMAYQSNLTVIKGLVAKFPELKDAFAGVVARAVEPSGRDYGTLLQRKEIR